MDEKRLDELIIGDVGYGERSWAIGHITEEEAEEILRLARIGFWADKHGVPALRYYVGEPQDYGGPASKALAALKAVGHPV